MCDSVMQPAVQWVEAEQQMDSGYTLSQQKPSRALKEQKPNHI